MTHILRLGLAVLLGLGVWLPLASEAQGHPLRQLVVVGTVAGDGALHGVLSVTRLALTETGQLVMTGTLAGTAGPQLMQETFTAIADHFRHGEEGPNVCTQLTLDLAPVHLDVVGLTVAVERLTLELTAQRGPDALLGQLLCALTYLLDNPTAHARGMQLFLNIINPRLSPGEASP
jgi:hypothetical protein